MNALLLALTKSIELLLLLLHYCLYTLVTEQKKENRTGRQTESGLQNKVIYLYIKGRGVQINKVTCTWIFLVKG